MRKTICKKQSKAFLALEQQIPAFGRSASGYTWNDIDICSRSSSRGMYGTYVMTPLNLHDYAQIASVHDKIKGYLRGHEHEENEFFISCKKEGEKVFITTLTVGTRGFYGIAFGNMNVQGFLFEAAPRVRDWKKMIMCMNETGPAYLDPAIYGMYESIYRDSF
jgi:hypothetical protein